MPWLFVDYDQGCGGESFCAKLSSSPECETLEYEVFENGRTKVFDRFSQEWLKYKPDIKIVDSHPTLYSVVPIHGRTQEASNLLGKISSIRIANPTDPTLIKIIKDNLVKKTLQTVEPNAQYYYGVMRSLIPIAVDPKKLSKLPYGTKTIDLFLTAFGYEVNDENRQQLEKNFRDDVKPEPQYNYDLIIPYADLHNNKRFVCEQLHKIFGITLNDL